MAAQTQKLNMLMTASLDFLEYAKNLDNNLNADKKFELLQKAKQLCFAVKEAQKEAVLITEEQQDQLGMNYMEKYFNILKVQ